MAQLLSVLTDMTIQEYRDGALKTAIYPTDPAGVYTNLGLREESGEVCGKFKKLMRDEGWLPGQPIPEDKRLSIVLELGDMCWYLVNIMHEDHISFIMSLPEEYQESATAYYNLGIVALLDEICAFTQLITCERPHLTSMRRNCWWMFIYIACIAHLCGYSLNDVFKYNLEKLDGRVKRGTLHGSGDNR